MSLMLFLVERYLPGIEEFAALVEKGAQENIANGVDAEAAYRDVMNGILSQLRQRRDGEVARREALSPPGEAVDGRLTLTLARLLDNRNSTPAKIKRKNMLDGVGRYVTYIVRDGDTVLYVGATHYDARKRLREHVASQSSPLGHAIRKSRNQSKEWTVEMIANPNFKAALAKEEELTVELRPTLCARFMTVGD